MGSGSKEMLSQEGREKEGNFLYDLGFYQRESGARGTLPRSEN
jgi:hypothetical protein